MGSTTTQPVSLTSGAIQQLHRIRAEQEIPEDHGLRIGVKGGGCSGLMYDLSFDSEEFRDASTSVSA